MPRAASPREAALLLGVNERTIRRAIARGELAATKEGRRFRISAEAINRFRQRQRASSGETSPLQPTAPPRLLALAWNELARGWPFSPRRSPASSVELLPSRRELPVRHVLSSRASAPRRTVLRGRSGVCCSESHPVYCAKKHKCAQNKGDCK